MTPTAVIRNHSYDIIDIYYQQSIISTMFLKSLVQLGLWTCMVSGSPRPQSPFAPGNAGTTVCHRLQETHMIQADSHVRLEAVGRI
jgi:hypothetical protein